MYSDTLNGLSQLTICYIQWPVSKSGEKEGVGIVWFSTTQWPHSHRSYGITASNAYPLKNQIIPNSASCGAHGTTQHVSWQTGSVLLSLLSMWPRESWTLTVASLGIMQFPNGNGFGKLYPFITWYLPFSGVAEGSRTSVLFSWLCPRESSNTCQL